ncbi:MAG: hypothetical protein HETSPECPRED_002375 [Heterodermia speciosa]|uniref:Rhodopsin domain-containing protein n=1 Tax=Heterodermia speciosa TaxID=116794 RepID=A0A8H3J431_9LECA|nr:MAG: hypothetical protein HETSPECPRED_002375 [Heterodermia speciosa]
MPMTQEQIDYQVAHKNQDRASEIVNVHIILMVFTVIGVSLRFISRRLKAGLGIDDWVMLAALIVFLGEGSGVLYCTTNFKSARHMLFVRNPVGIAKASKHLKLFLVDRRKQCLYSTGISLCKLSVLLMYNRIFGRANKPFRCALIATGLFVIAYNFIQFIIIIFQCSPVRAAWDPTVENPKCIKLMLELEIAGGFNALTENANANYKFANSLITLILPLPILWRTQMPPKKKVQVICTFLVGGFVTIVSFWRIPMQAGISLVDASYTDVTACNWSYVEVSVAIICGSLPAMRPLLTWCLNGGKLEPTVGSGAKKSYPSASPSSSSPSWVERNIWDKKAKAAVHVSEVSETNPA